MSYCALNKYSVCERVSTEGVAVRAGAVACKMCST